MRSAFLLFALSLVPFAFASGQATADRMDAGNKTRYAIRYAGTNAGEKIKAAITDLPAGGGTVDARGFEGTQTITSDPFAGNSKIVTLLIGHATYMVSASIKPTSGATIEGQGGGLSVFQLANGANIDVFSSSDTTGGNSNIYLRNFRITGNSPNQTGTARGIYFKKVNQFRIENLEVYDNRTHGIFLDDGCNYGWILNNRVEKVIVGSGILAGNTPPNAKVSELTIAGNYVSDIRSQNGIFVLGATAGATSFGTEHIVIKGNRVESAKDVSIEVGWGAQDAIVIGNSVFVKNAAGGNAGATGILIRSSRKILVSGNVVNGDTSASGQDGIVVLQGAGESVLTNVSVVGNKANENGRYGIQLNSGDDILLADNKAVGNTSAPYLIGGTVTNVRQALNDDGIITPHLRIGTSNTTIDGFLAIGGTTLNTVAATGYVVAKSDHAFNNIDNEARGIQSTIRYYRTVADAPSPYCTTIGCDVFAIGAALEVTASNTQQLIGQQKGIVSEEYFRKPTTGSYTVDRSFNYQGNATFGQNVTNTHHDFFVINQPIKGDTTPGTVTTGHGLHIENLDQSPAIFASGNAAAIKIDGLANFGRILWPGSSVRESSSGVLELGANSSLLTTVGLTVGSGASFGVDAASYSLTGTLALEIISGERVSTLGYRRFKNQAAAPGTPSAGYVSLYTKTGDKRLYYKDDAGTEIGPLTAASGITSLNGLTAGTQTFATGTSGSDFNISSATSTHTFNIPDASSTARGLVTTAAQSFAGDKTFLDKLTSNKAVSAGTAVGDGYYVGATQIVTGLRNIGNVVDITMTGDLVLSTSGKHVDSGGGSTGGYYVGGTQIVNGSRVGTLAGLTVDGGSSALTVVVKANAGLGSKIEYQDGITAKWAAANSTLNRYVINDAASSTDRLTLVASGDSVYRIGSTSTTNVHSFELSNGTAVFRVSDPGTDTYSAFELVWNNGGVRTALTRVLIGGTDSCGTGFRCLRIAN